MLEQLKHESAVTATENGAKTYSTTLSACLDLFAAIGAIRRADDQDIINRFVRAFAEDRETAMRILFFGRDIRGGLGERRVFRVIVKWLADNEPEALRRSIALIPEYGRYDDLLALMDTACEQDAINLIRDRLIRDMSGEGETSLLAKWLPSVNASNAEAVRLGKKIARALKISDAEYRRMLSALRRRIHILENNLRKRDYTFDYAAQPSRAMLKYRTAFWRNDGERYDAYLTSVEKGEAKLHTGTLMPYEIIEPCLDHFIAVNPKQRRTMDVTWNALEDFTQGENALVVADGSGSMYTCNKPSPIGVAMSLAVYFAERNRGAFRNHFITFSERPQLVEIRGRDITEKVRHCASFNEAANTDLDRVFDLILTTAVKNRLPQEEMPSRLYIVSDMEFDYCMDNADVTNFERARKLFEQHGYRLPEIIFWNVASRHGHQPVQFNEQGAALVSGCSPRLFSMVASGNLSPMKAMMDVIGSERYAAIHA